MTLFFAFVIAVFTTMALIPPLMRWAAALHIVDMPDARKVHQGIVPRVGGIAMVSGALIPMILWLPPAPKLIAYIGGALIILFFGVWDDRSNLDYRIKFLGQILAALVVILYGGVLITHVPFLDEPLPFFLAFPLTVVAILGITNAINLADGLDGLAGGTTLLSIGLLALLAYLTDASYLLLISVVIMGCILGFLRFNSHPASVFMGDGGSQFLGFSAGVLAIMLTQDAAQAISPVLPVLFLGLPILDTFMVMGQRIAEGRSPFSPDKNHIHHKLLELGFNHYEAVFLIYVAQAVLVSSAYFLRFHSDLMVLAVYLIFCLSVVVFFRYGKLIHLKRHEKVGGEPITFIGRSIEWLKQGRWLERGAYYFALLSIPLYLGLMTLFSDRIPQHSYISLVSWALLAIMAFASIKRVSGPLHLVERACLYVTIVFVVYLVQVRPGALAGYEVYQNTYFVLLVIAVAISFRFAGPNRFKVSTLDFLIIFLAVTVPNIAGGDSHLGKAIAEVIVLFYGVEVVLSSMWRRWILLRLSTMTILLMLGLRGI